MPELPEVETLRRSLAPRLVGRRIEAVHVRETRLREPVSRRRLAARISRRRVEAVRRRSKYLLIEMERGQHLLVHLGMSGRLTLHDRGEALERHVHVVFDLDDGNELRYRDPRRFGMVDALSTSELGTDRRLCDLGIEPLSPRCTPEYLYERSRGVRKPVKNFVMDAHQICGVGNIYANEALFEAGIHPQRAAGRLSRRSWTALDRAIKAVLTRAIEEGGTTINDFQDGSGQPGAFQNHLRVYDRAEKPCPNCEAQIRLKVLAGRSTYYCPRCQR